jgi:hypothetical protein
MNDRLANSVLLLCNQESHWFQREGGNNDTNLRDANAAGQPVAIVRCNQV